MRDQGLNGLTRLFSARSIAVVGGGAWCASIIGAAQRIGYQGEIFPVHPSGKDIAGLPSYKTLGAWKGPIDAAFIGVNRHATLDVVSELRALGAGGAICFASGFSEAVAEDEASADLQAELVARAGDMPVLGPNCYGFVNALDRVAIWPDQHGMTPVDSGVAILTQSSNIAINLTMQQRELPIAYMVTCGNMAQTSQAEIAFALLDDPRVTAIGLHIEGFGDTGIWHKVALKAARRDVPLVAIKVGVSEQARYATISHTASLAGSDAGADALLARFGIARVYDLSSFLETLKLLHVVGRLPSNQLSSISCSGGEASLVADTANGQALSFPELSPVQKASLERALGPMVALANPLDYHTYIWRNPDAMTAAWLPMAAPHIGLTLIVVDYPITDASDWDCATQAALAVRAKSKRPVAVVASLPELMPSDVAQRLLAGGVVPMRGLREAIVSAEAAARVYDLNPEPPLRSGDLNAQTVLSEADAKFALSAYDLDLPRRIEGDLSSLETGCKGLLPPLVLKGQGLAHKSEAGAVVLGLAAHELEAAARSMSAEHFLVEEMVTDGVVELLIGVTRDPAHGFLLTLAAGGVLTEILQDSVSLLLPVRSQDVEQALNRLRAAKLIDGFRGKPPASRAAIVASVMAVQAYVMDHHAELGEVEINPLICTPTRAVAVDALIRKV